MKTRLLVILLVFATITGASGSYRIKGQAALAHTPATSAPALKQGIIAVIYQAAITNRMHHIPHLHEGDDDKNVRSNTNGVLSVVFGILGLLTFPLLGGVFFGVPAMILGRVGHENDERYSRTGRILGIVALLLSCTVFFFALAFVGGS